MWISILHHVVNEHSWARSDGKSEGRCGHDALDDKEKQKPWLAKNSAPQASLRQIMLNKRFLNTIPYCTRFR